MFAQGGRCFFCKQPLPKTEASVEHLVASANGGSNNDENRVACCKAVNALLGSMSLKEKIRVMLNQQGQFKCPNGSGSTKRTVQPKTTTGFSFRKSKDSQSRTGYRQFEAAGSFETTNSPDPYEHYCIALP